MSRTKGKAHLDTYLVSSIQILLKKACLDTKTIPHLPQGSKRLARRADVLITVLRSFFTAVGKGIPIC